MPATHSSDACRETAAHPLLEQLRLRTSLNEGIGILQVWDGCAQQSARDHLLTEHGRSGQDAEAGRMITIVDAAANGRSDPDVRWH